MFWHFSGGQIVRHCNLISPVRRPFGNSSRHIFNCHIFNFDIFLFSSLNFVFDVTRLRSISAQGKKYRANICWDFAEFVCFVNKPKSKPDQQTWRDHLEFQCFWLWPFSQPFWGCFNLDLTAVSPMRLRFVK